MGKGRSTLLPKYLRMNMRQFKKKKRKDFKILNNEMNMFRKNIIYLPPELLLEFNKVEEQFNEFAIKAKKWWEKA